MVSFVKTSGKICLAIGDGANDASMLVEASVGVGLYGKEGLQAVQVSDYGIPSFKYLWRLVFFEGRRNYMRIAEFFQYYIYKSALFTLVQFCYGFYNLWSGMTVFDGWYIYIYLTLLSVFSISWMGVADEDIRYQYVRSLKKNESKTNIIQNEGNPHLKQDFEYVKNMVFETNKRIKKIIHKLYYMSQKETFLSNYFMIYTCIEALCMSIIVLVISAEMVKYSALNIDGHDGGDYTNLSFTVYTIILINISFLVFLNAKHLTLFLLMINLLTTFLPYGVFVYIYDRLVLLNVDTSYSSRFVFSKLIFWLRVLVITVVSMIPQVIQLLLRFYKWPSIAEYLLVLKAEKKLFKDKYWQEEVFSKIKLSHMRQRMPNDKDITNNNIKLDKIE